MWNKLRKESSRMISLILSATLAITMNTVNLGVVVYAEDGNVAVEGNFEAGNTDVEESAQEIETVEDLLTNGDGSSDDDYLTLQAGFADFLFYYYDIYDFDDNDDIDNWIRVDYEMEDGDYIKTRPTRSSIEAVSELVIKPTERIDKKYVKDWTDIAQFTNLTSLTIDGIEIINSIAFPSSLTSLTITNCKFNCIPDLSGCTNLTSLTFTNNTTDNEFSIINHGADFTIRGLDNRTVNESGMNSEIGSSTLTKLQEARFDGSSLNYIFLPETNVQGTGELIFTAVNCTQLYEVNTGGYKLINGFSDTTQYAPSFKGDDDLGSITIKGIADRETQTLNIEGCSRLTDTNISYYFNDSSYVLEVKASGITSIEGEANFCRLDGSAEGKYKIDGFDNTYLTEYADSYPELFVAVSVTTSDVAFIVPEQDYKEFVEKELWKDSMANKRRDYETNPILLSIKTNYDAGAHPYEFNNNTMHFFTKNGIELTDYSVNVKITTIEKPTEQELRNAGFNDAQISEYQVVSVDNERRNEITALNPGKAKITFSVGAISVDQVIIVESPLVSATIDNVSSDGSQDFFDSYGDYTFSVTFDCKYPSLAKYSDLDVQWIIFKKTGDNTYADYITKEGYGLKINRDYTSRSLDSANRIHYTYKFSVLTTSSGGEFAIGGEVFGNKHDAVLRMDIGIVRDSSSEVITNAASTAYKFSVVNMGTNLHSAPVNVPPYLKDYYLCYQVKWEDYSWAVSEIDFNLPVLSGTSDYITVAPEIVNTTITYTDYLKIVPDGEGTEKYKLVFRDDKSSAEIGTFLRSLSDDTRKVTVKAYVKKKDGKVYNTVKEFSETVNIVGRFTVTYDYDGISVADDKNNTKEYYVPSNVQKVYSSSFNLTTPTNDGYDFEGWECNGKSFTGITDDIVGNITVKATWKGKEFTNTLIYDANLGEGVSMPEKVEQTVTFPNTKCSIEVYNDYYGEDQFDEVGRSLTFAGWYTEKTAPADPVLYTGQTDPRMVGDTVEVGYDDVAGNQSLTLYAYWEYTKPVVSEASITFGGDSIGLNFILTNMGNYISGNADETAYISFNDEEYWVDEGTEQGDGSYMYTAHVNAKNIHDEIVVHVYRKDKDGNKVTIPIENDNNGDGKFAYSIYKYAEAAHQYIDNEYLDNFLRAILKYGECASFYFDYNNYLENVPSIDTPGSKGTIIDTGYSDYEAEFSGTLPDGVTYLGSSLILESATTVRHYFLMENPGNIQVVVRGEDATIHKEGGLYYIDDVYSYKDLGNKGRAITVSDDKTTFTMNYCVLSYCEIVNRTSDNEALIALANSLYWVDYYRHVYLNY